MSLVLGIVLGGVVVTALFMAVAAITREWLRANLSAPPPPPVVAPVRAVAAAAMPRTVRVDATRIDALDR